MSTLAALILRMREYSESLPDELDLGIPVRRDAFDKLLETNKEES
jgi:hypothetical protein